MSEPLSLRKFLESPITQGKDETIAYKFDTALWGSLAPASPVNTIYCDGVDQPSLLSGSPSIAGTVFTTSKVRSLKEGKRYKIICQWQDSGNTFSAYGELIGEI